LDSAIWDSANWESAIWDATSKPTISHREHFSV
jgi:hypothetical protein